ncbi:hypothetical protein [Sphingobium sp. B2D3C]|uniref:hypothetical protein n=1 Tax=Sphingobium sp. B2D3C TaxID=2940581 RepID=UPI002224F8CF|nr:hypothetical protein [Sphingobium sp. B2D3C]MCW2397922.1 hypothetical protein [Sphingobium sp. B2D3C]
MLKLQQVAPAGEIVEYDRQHLSLYAQLIDAADAKVDWQVGTVEILGFDPSFDEDAARRCWDTHVARARWIVGNGLPSAVKAFGKSIR